MIKTVLALVNGSAGIEMILSESSRVAERFGAHLDVLHVLPDPASLIPILDDGVPAPLIGEMLATAEAAVEKRAAEARAAYDRFAARPGLSASWNQETGRQSEIAAASARLHDLTIVGRPGEGDAATWMDTIEALLFDTGRPVLILPATPPAATDCVTIGWNGSAQAARAVADALPFLRMAESVNILTAGSTDPLASPEGLVAYLARHDIDATTAAFEATSATVGDGLLEHSRKLKANLLVMGAYGHSRLRETILGGATRDILKNADLPVLLSH